jgi:hypothetical protein
VNHDDVDDRPYVPRLMNRWLVVLVSLVLLTIYSGPYVLTLVHAVRDATREPVDSDGTLPSPERVAEYLETLRDPHERRQATLLAFAAIYGAELKTQRRIVRAWIEHGAGSGFADQLPTATLLVLHRAGPAPRDMLLEELARGLLSPTVNRAQLAHSICSMYSNADPSTTGFQRITFPGCDTDPTDDRAINTLATYLTEWRLSLAP